MRLEAARSQGRVLTHRDVCGHNFRPPPCCWSHLSRGSVVLSRGIGRVRGRRDVDIPEHAVAVRWRRRVCRGSRGNHRRGQRPYGWFDTAAVRQQRRAGRRGYRDNRIRWRRRCGGEGVRHHVTMIAGMSMPAGALIGATAVPGMMEAAGLVAGSRGGPHVWRQPDDPPAQPGQGAINISMRQRRSGSGLVERLRALVRKVGVLTGTLREVLAQALCTSQFADGQLRCFRRTRGSTSSCSSSWARRLQAPGARPCIQRRRRRYRGIPGLLHQPGRSRRWWGLVREMARRWYHVCAGAELAACDRGRLAAGACLSNELHAARALKQICCWRGSTR